MTDSSETWLASQYHRRFAEEDASRRAVWRVLIDAWFARDLVGVRSVLDLGCGWGHFINQVDVPERHAIDLNPSAREHLEPDVALHVQPANDRWPLDDGCLDLVFTSNFLEHLPNREAIASTLAEAHRCLRPGGRLVALGPNIRVVRGAYWDFFDHLVPLTERSVAEAVELVGLTVESSIPRFLPYTMAGRRRPRPVAIRAYLRCRPAWRVLGQQFLVTARKVR